MGMQGGSPGMADYWAPGDWNAACSLCGRKRKFTYLERNWQGMYRCPEHNEPRQPQDFVRGIPDKMGVPYSLFEEQTFTSTTPGFSARVVPSAVQMVGISADLDTESGIALETEGGQIIDVENTIYLSPPASVLLPDWLSVPEAPPWFGKGTDLMPSETINYQWSWVTPNPTVTITNPTSSSTSFQTVNSSAPTTQAQVVVTLPNGANVTLLVTVSIVTVGQTYVTYPLLIWAMDL